MSNSYLRRMREKVGSERIFLPGVRAIIPNDRGEILLQRRTDVSLWGLPGGSVEMGETVLEALSREVTEETSLEVVEAEPMGLYTGPNQKLIYPNGDEIQCFAIALIVKKWKGQPRADGVEGSELLFFSLSDLPEELVAIHQPTIEDYRDYDGTFVLSG